MVLRVNDLDDELQRLDGRGYPAYRSLRGRRFEVGDLGLCLEHVQGDPFASPSRLRVDVPPSAVRLPPASLAAGDARRAAADFIQRKLLRALATRPRERGARGRRSGSGKSGLIAMAGVGQEVLERTALRVERDASLVIRLTVGLPASGRRILGRSAAELLCGRLPALIDSVLGDLDHERLMRHVCVVEDQVALRAALRDEELVAFVADGSILPRRSGADDRPLTGAVVFAAPSAMRVELQAPHAGRVTGLGIRNGVTVIVGGGYHGKSTLLQALSRGVYDQMPGDGRELCVTRDSAVNIRAEDGRSVRGVDLRPFISNLPLGKSTHSFDTDDASGSTSQAASIVEALEVGATALLIDEDTAAANFMTRDARMRVLVPASAEPITPFLDRVTQLYERVGISSVLVIGGAGDYFDVADAVIQMRDYAPHDITARAKDVAARYPQAGDSSGTELEADFLAGEGQVVDRLLVDSMRPKARGRVPLPASFDARRGRRAERVRSVKTRAIEFGEEEIDVSLLSQLVDPAQCRMIGDVLLLCGRELGDGERDLGQILAVVEERVATEGLGAVCEASFGDRARARRFEVAAAINRLRSLRIDMRR